MFGLCCKRMSHQMLSSVSPLLAGLICGVILNLATRTQVLVGEGSATLQSVSTTADLTDRSNFFQHLETNRQNEANKNKFARPKYIRDEIRMRKRILLAVILDGETTPGFDEYLNMSLSSGGSSSSSVDKVLYLTQPDIPHHHQRSDVILLPDIDLFEVVTYLAKSHGDGYLLYFLVPGSSLVNGRLLDQLVFKLQFESNVLMGGGGGPGCELSSGLLMSGDVLARFLLSPPTACHQPAASLFAQSKSDRVACLQQVAQVNCEGRRRTARYTALSAAAYMTVRKQPLLVYNIASNASFVAAMSHFIELEAAALKREADSLADQLRSYVTESQYELAADWPEQVFKPALEVDRFDRDVSLHMNGSHVENVDPYQPASLLTADQLAALQPLAERCAREEGYHQADLVEGWRRTVPTSGISSRLVLEHSGPDRAPLRSECLSFQELAEPRLLSLPFVTETTRISLILPVAEADAQEVLVFLKNFAKNVLDRRDRVLLMLVFLYTPERPDKNNNKDFYREVKQAALLLSKKYKKAAGARSHILWYSMQLRDESPPAPLELVDLVIQKLDSSILLLGSLYMEMHPDYLNRVRMNTIAGRLIYAPFPFTAFHPQITGSSAKRSLTYDPNMGTFDALNTDHLSFYKTDYLASRQSLEQQVPYCQKEEQLVGREQLRSLPRQAFHLHEMFRGNLHVLRAPEPSLRVRYRRVDCLEAWPTEVLRNCEKQQTRSLGTRAQLANLYMDHQAAATTPPAGTI